MKISVYNWVLDKFDNILEVDVRYYLKNSIYMMANNVVTVVFALMLSVMLARVLTEEAFGQYNFIISILGIISIISLPGINAAVNQSVANGYDGSYKMGLFKKIKYSILGSMAIFAIAMYYFISGNILLSYGFLIGALFFPMVYPLQLFGYYLMGKRDFKRYSIYMSILVAFVSVTTMIVAYYIRDFVIATMIYLGTTSAMNILFSYKIMKEKKSGKIDKGMLEYSKHLNIMTILGTIRLNIDRIIVGLFLGFESLAIYTVANTVPKQAKPVWTIISNIIFPNLSKKKKEDAYSAFKKRFPWFVLLSVLMIIGGMLILPPIILYFYSAKYAESIFYFRILMLSTVSGLSYLIASVPTSQKDIGKMYRINVVNPLIGIVLLFVLTYMYGLMGACIGTVIGTGIIPVCFSYYTLYHEKKSDKES